MNLSDRTVLQFEGEQRDVVGVDGAGLVGARDGTLGDGRVQGGRENAPDGSGDMLHGVDCVGADVDECTRARGFLGVAPRERRVRRSAVISVVPGGVTVGILLMNKFNRRSMIITGYVLTTTFHALVGIFALALPDNTVKPYVIMILVIGFVFSMQALIGPLTWLLLSEIFPLKIRSFAMGVCVFMLSIANSIVAFGFPPTVDALGISSTFFLFAALGLAAIIFMGRMAPETRGRTLEQFEDDFRVQHS